MKVILCKFGFCINVVLNIQFLHLNNTWIIEKSYAFIKFQLMSISKICMQYRCKTFNDVFFPQYRP